MTKDLEAVIEEIRTRAFGELEHYEGGQSQWVEYDLDTTMSRIEAILRANWPTDKMETDRPSDAGYDLRHLPPCPMPGCNGKAVYDRDDNCYPPHSVRCAKCSFEVNTDTMAVQEHDGKVNTVVETWIDLPRTSSANWPTDKMAELREWVVGHMGHDVSTIYFGEEILAKIDELTEAEND